MKKRCGKTLTLSILMALLAGTVPVFAEDVTGQQVTIDQNQEGGLICGGHAKYGNASNNTLSILGSASITSLNSDNATVAGGYAEDGDAIGNTVNISSTGNHEIGGIYGGALINKSWETSIDKNASGNQLTITGGTFSINNGIFGGAAPGDTKGIIEATINNNRISIGDGADITLTSKGWGNYICGGFSSSGLSSTANGNQVTLKGTIKGAGYICGGMVSHTAENNMVTIGDGADITFSDRGPGAENGIFGGYADATDSTQASGNQVTLKGKIKGDGVTYKICGGLAGTAEDNMVTIGDGANITFITFSDVDPGENGISGGYAYSSEARGNQVTLSGGTIKEAKFIAGAMVNGPTANDNMVNLSGTMDLDKNNLYGWFALSDNDITHSGNTLNVGYTAEMTRNKDLKPTITGKPADWHGSKVQGIYNFDKIAFYNVESSQPALTVTDTVSLPDNVALDLDHFVPADGGNVLTDNVLIDASGASTVKGLDKLYESGKDKYQQPVTRTYANGGVTVTGKEGLALDTNVLSYGLRSLDTITYKTIDWKTDGTVLTLADSQKFDLTDTQVHTEDIGFTAKSLETITKAGNYAMTLLDTQGNKTLSAGNLTTKKGTWNVGNALEGTGEASLEANGNVVYKLDTVEKAQKPEVKVDAAKQTHNALIANEAALGTLAAGRDRMEGLLDTFNGQEGGVFTFASIGGSKDKYDTGSHSSTYTWNGLAGVGNDVALHNGDFSYGVFYEYGKGHYDVDGAGYTGSGDAHYSGAGLMARYVARNKNYGEASLHFGQLKNNADSVLHSRSGSALGYETDSSYWSGHVGFGHIFDLTDQVASTSRGGTDRASRDLDVYGKYFYTHVGGDSFRAGDVDYQLDDLNSSLLRIGARLNNRSGRNNYYCGLAWDYEFDGESRGTVSAAGLSANIRKADIGGSSLMAEAGWKLEATRDSPWDVNLSLQAYAGQHKGIGGNVFVGYHF